MTRATDEQIAVVERRSPEVIQELRELRAANEQTCPHCGYDPKDWVLVGTIHDDPETGTETFVCANPTEETMSSREAAIEAICNLEEEASDELFGTPEPIRNAFRAGVEQGFDAGYAAASQDRAWVPVETLPTIPSGKVGVPVWITYREGEKWFVFQGYYSDTDATGFSWWAGTTPLGTNRYGDVSPTKTGEVIAWKYCEPKPSPYVPTKGVNDDR